MSMDKNAKVFLSSTFVDLIEYRKKAIEVLNRYKCVPLAMEFFDSLTQDPQTVCEDEIRECDIFIGIYAHRFGWAPKRKRKSITRMEYELARELKKDRLCFIVDENVAWKPKFIEHDKQKELKRFLKIVKNDLTISFFKDPQDLAVKLATSLGKLLAKKQAPAGKAEKGEPPGRVIPLAPLPYMAHPYPLRENFTGRAGEMAALSNWFYNESQPVLVMEAIGGMGKSALSWVWLQKQITERPGQTAGVFWWSFYDEPFDSFIGHLARYVTGVEKQESVDMAELVATLCQRGFLLVLDGLERALRGYAGMETMFIQEKRFAGDKTAEAEWDRVMREPVHPVAARFLQALSTCKTKTLITSRLMPAPLEGLGGVKHLLLTGLSGEDTVSFLAGEGVKGSRAELETAGRVYGNHPLMLTLLAAAIKRSRTRDIKDAFAMNLIDRKEPHKILSTGFNLLSEEERQVATALSVFRGVFTFDAAIALLPEIEENGLWERVMELRGLGFLFYDEAAQHFDLHPIMRAFLYGRLSSSGHTGVHTLAIEYFQALPKPEKVVTLEDLAPVIELYHHLVKAGKFDKARDIFDDKIHKATYYQFAAYHLGIELLRQLFPNLDNGPPLPRLKTKAAQAWTLNTLATTYAISGQPSKAVPMFLLQNKLREKYDNKRHLAVGLGAVASTSQSYIGQFSACSSHLRKRISLCHEIEDEFNEAIGHRELGRVLAFRGKNYSHSIEDEFRKAFDLAGKSNHIQNQGLTLAYRSRATLLSARLVSMLPGEEDLEGKHNREALEQSFKALDFAKKSNLDERFVTPFRDFVRAYWLLGESLIQCWVSTGMLEPFDIPFYDEHFKRQTDAVSVTKGNELTAAERCLLEALRRCRKTNMVVDEPDILLALARLDRAKQLPPNQTYLEEAHTIAQRAGYRRVSADLHLLCGQILLDGKWGDKLLDLTAKEHLEQAQEYALDVSEFEHLYQSPDPDFYKGIEEYEMLKRGMTRQERVENGYWVAYRIAEELLKRN
jgi:hypothetical protein